MHEHANTASLKPHKAVDAGLHIYVRFVILVVLKTTMLFFWVVTPCGLLGRYKRLGRAYCLHL
jgi:hypothetical protein